MNTVKYGKSLLLPSWAPQLPRNILAHAGFLCYKAAMFRKMMNKRQYICEYWTEQIIYYKINTLTESFIK